MKVIGLILATLSLVAFAQAKHDYRLRCTQQEMGIRWPSYLSHSEYYVCPRVAGKQMTITCNPGEVFTFVLQMCTDPSKYIPAPEFEILPTATPLLAQNVAHPPIVSEMKPPVLEIASWKPQHPPTLAIEASKPPVELVEEHKHDGEHHAGHYAGHQAEHHVEHHTEEEIVKDDKPSKPVVLPPMPPTPAPTPPVVDPVLAGSAKKPQLGLSKKPASDKKKTPAAKPSKTENAKPTAEKAGKKSPKNSKRPAPTKKSSAIKAPAKKSSAIKAPAKKSPAKKAPVKA